ncbi:MAG: hypothetical protein LAP40_02245 [Acidobacteriia bacterium]|nr:hypothetical protein [Terriglobia bacterium]
MRIWWASVTLMLATGAAHAQNSDLAILAGISGPRGQVTTAPTTVISGSVGASGEVNYAWQALQRAVDLYIELPLVITGQDRGTVTPGRVSDLSFKDVFFTPGARLKISPQSRVSVYAALGGGIASMGTTMSVVSPGSVSETSNRATTAALDFGGGLDFRLTRLLSLRAEGRDFVTRASLGSAGRNHWMFLAGIAFHF